MRHERFSLLAALAALGLAALAALAAIVPFALTSARGNTAVQLIWAFVLLSPVLGVGALVLGWGSRRAVLLASGVLVVWLLGLTGLLLVGIIGSGVPKEKLARSEELGIGKAAVLYCKKTGTWPRQVEVMSPPGCSGPECVLDGQLIDPWAKPFRLEFTDGNLVVVSAGPNGVFEKDGDDIRTVVAPPARGSCTGRPRKD